MRLIFIISLLFWGWAEMSTFIYIGNKVGGLLTLFGIFITAVLGITLLKKQGMSVLHRIRKDMANGHASMSSVADSISLVIGGVLMLVPGYLTDAIGLFLFIPGLRTLAGIYFLKWIASNKRFDSFISLNGNKIQSGRKPHVNKYDRQESTGYSEQHDSQAAFNDIIEGDFEERVDYTSQLKKNKITKP